jgi:hypothetical protein
MIKILPTGTSAVLKYGLKPTRTNKSRGRLGDGSKECSFELGAVELDAVWKDNFFETVLKTTGEVYIRKITLEFRFRSPRPVAETAVWTESYSDTFPTGHFKSIPGTFSGNSVRHGAWALWLSESSEAEGIFFRQSPPAEYPVKFCCKPGAKTLSISWEINRSFNSGESLTLPKVGISRGSSKQVIRAWYREWKNSSSREHSRDRRTGWCGGNEIRAPKDLREILGSIRNSKISVNWFAIGPDYASTIGDWLTPSDAFKDRMGSVSRNIGENNIVPGLRFAPFLVSKKSILATENRGWLVKNSSGSPLSVPGYAGVTDNLFVLDITQPEVMAHVKKTLSTMRDQWGFRAYFLERIGDLTIPGVRFDNRIGPGILLKTAAEEIRETLGSKVLLVASGLPLLTAPGVWDARVMVPSSTLFSGFFSRRKRRAAMSVASALLHRSPWNESLWINASGLIPLKIFNPECGSSARSIMSAITLSTGLVSLTGDPRNLDEETLKSINDFIELFEDCRTGRLALAPNIGGGRTEPVIVRNDRGWIALFNLSDGKKEVRLERDKLKSALGVSAPLSAGDGAVFNSPEIHVALPPRGHRLFRG